MKIQFAPIFIAFLYHVLVANASLPCYTSNGTLALSIIQPYNSNLPTGSHSACCALGRTPPDVCFSNGLCLTGTSIYSNGLIFANGCTDPTGKDPSCQEYCTDRSLEIYVLDPCEDGRWCCQTADNLLSSCCINGQGSFYMHPGTVLFPSAAISSGQVSTQVSTQVVTSTQIISTCSSSPLPSQHSRSKETILGASIGASLGTALLASLLVILFLLRRQRKHQLHVQSATVVGPRPYLGPAEIDSIPKTVYPFVTQRSYPPEIDGRQIGENIPASTSTWTS